MKRTIIFILILSIMITSCTVSRVQVGNYETMKGKVTVYKKSKDFYLFWDQVPIQRVEKKLKVTDYEIITKRKFFDSLIYYSTLGIFSFYDVKIKTKEAKEN